MRTNQLREFFQRSFLCVPILCTFEFLDHISLITVYPFSSYLYHQSVCYNWHSWRRIFWSFLYFCHSSYNFVTFMFVLSHNLSFIACFRTFIFVSWNSRVISSDILKNQKSLLEIQLQWRCNSRIEFTTFSE